MWVETLEDGSLEQRTVKLPHDRFPRVHAARKWFEYLNELVYSNSWGVSHRVFDEVKLPAYTSGSTER